MKKTKLFEALDYDFELLGLVSNVKEHKLAWQLNQLPFFHFVKKDDIKIEFNYDTSILISNCKSEKLHHEFTLLKNKLSFSNHASLNYLIPELYRFDYFIKFRVLVDGFDIDQLISSIRNLPVVDYMTLLDLSKIKQKENLLY